jgi:hypothetical protein
MGLAFFLRYFWLPSKVYRFAARLTGIVFLAYALLQLPIYILIFVPSVKDPESHLKHTIMYSLAGGKFLKFALAAYFFWNPFWWRKDAVTGRVEGSDLQSINPAWEDMAIGQVFFSYYSKDNHYVQQIANALKKEGYTTWHFKEGSMVGKNHLDESTRQIKVAEAVVLLISEKSLASHQITAELALARAQKKLLLPVLVDISHECCEKQATWRDILGATVDISIKESVEIESKKMEESGGQVDEAEASKKGIEDVTKKLIKSLREAHIEPAITVFPKPTPQLAGGATT